MLRLEGPRLAEVADQYQCRFGFTRWPAASLRRSAEAARLVGSRYLKNGRWVLIMLARKIRGPAHRFALLFHIPLA